MRFFFCILTVICVKRKEWVLYPLFVFDATSIDVMLQFDANAHAHANVDASVNEAL